MPNSGIKPTDEVKKAYNLVFKRNGGLPYAIFKFSDDLKEVVIDDDEQFYAKQLSYQELIGNLPSDKPRFIAYEFEHLTKESTQPTKTPIIVSWAPKNCGIKLKFLVGATFMAMVNDLNNPKYLEGDDLSELDESCVCDKNDWKMLPAEQRTVSDKPVDIKSAQA